MPIKLDGIENLRNLNYLSAEKCEIDDISMLSNLSNLEILCIDNNNISDISALLNLQNLKRVYLSGNLILDYTPISNYYNNLEEKDFPLNGERAMSFKISEIDDKGNIIRIKIKKTELGSSIDLYTTIKYINKNGALLSKYRKQIEYSSLMLPNSMKLTEETDVVVEFFEKDNEKQSISQMTITNSTFSFPN